MPEARLARWSLPLGLVATTLTFRAMFASSTYSGAGIGSVPGNTQTFVITRIVAVGETKWQRGMATFCKLFTIARIQYFEHDEAAAARSWLNEA